jgi:hypothetical protein
MLYVLPLGFQHEKLLSSALYYAPSKQKLCATYLTLLEIEIFIDSEPMTLCIEVSIIPWVMKAGTC